MRPVVAVATAREAARPVPQFATLTTRITRRLPDVAFVDNGVARLARQTLPDAGMTDRVSVAAPQQRVPHMVRQTALTVRETASAARVVQIGRAKRAP